MYKCIISTSDSFYFISRIRNMLFILLLTLSSEVVTSSGDIVIGDCSCTRGYFSPTYTTWASQYKGILYSAEYCDLTTVTWNVYYDLDNNVPTTYARHNILITTGWITTTQFDLNQFYSSVTEVGSCVVTTFEVTVPLNQSFNGIKVELVPACPGASCSCSTTNTHCVGGIINIRDCTATLIDDVMVMSSSDLTYNTMGNFGCLNGGKLFYTNATELPNNETVCLQSAQWSGQDGLQCWKAPSVTLLDNSTSCNAVGDTLMFTCLYDDTLPKGDKTRFVIGTDATDVTKGAPFLFSLQQQHYGSKIYCQAITLFTEIYTESGRSNTHDIFVFSKPANVKTNVDTSIDVISTETTVLLNSYQNVPLHCKSDVDSTNCVWKLNQTEFSRSCDTQQYFNQSGFVTCSVTNCAGSNESQLQVVVVDPRNSRIQQNAPVVEGQKLTLICNIDFQNELNTTFQWITPSNAIASSVSTLIVQNITRFEKGNYTCRTIDLFQKSSKDVDVIVLYKPYDVLLTPQESTNIVHTGSRLLLNGNQNVTLFCESDANPQANCSFQFANKSSESFSSCEITQHVISQQSVTCFAANAYGDGESRLLELIVVKENERIPNIQYDSNDTEQIFAGDDVTLNCSLTYQNELNTLFAWKIPSSDRDVNQNSAVLYLNQLTRFDWGNYTCITANDFGTAQNSAFLDVLFEPVSQNSNAVDCSHSDVENGTCIFQFSSNPSADIWTLKVNGTGVLCPSCIIATYEKSTLQTFHLFLTSTNDAQYELTIRSSFFPDAKLTAYIYVTIVAQTPPSGGDQTVIIATSVVGTIVLVAIVIATVLFYRRRYISRKADECKKQDVIYMNTQNEDKQDVARGSVESSETERNYEELGEHIYANDVDKPGSNYENVSFPNKDENSYATDI